MRLLLSVIVALCVWIPTSVFAVQSGSVPFEQTAPNEWIQGVAMTKERLYYVDGWYVDYLQDGKRYNYYDITKVADHLENFTKEDLYTFNLGDMQVKDGVLYISGFIFDDMQYDGIWEETKNGDREYRMGDAYTILFSIDKQKNVKVLHLSKIERQYGRPPNAIYDNAENKPMDGKDAQYVSMGYNELYAYFMYLNDPRFSFHEGGIVFPREQEGKIDILYNQNGNEKVLYTIDGDSSRRGNIEALPVIQNGTLTIYNNDGVRHINLKTKAEKNEVSSYLLERPIYRHGVIYFLNDNGIYTIKNNQIKWLVLSKDTRLSNNNPNTQKIWISHYDYLDGTFSLNDAGAHYVHWVRP